MWVLFMLNDQPMLVQTSERAPRIFALLRSLIAISLALLWLSGVICLGLVCLSSVIPNSVPYRVAHISEAMPTWAWLLLFFPAVSSIPIMVRQFLGGRSFFQRTSRS